MSDQTPLFQEPRPGAVEPGASDGRAASSGGSDPGELLAAVRTLQYQINTLLILLLVISGTLAVFFYMQSRYSGREVRNLRAVALPQIEDYNTNTVPRVQAFLNNLGKYAQTHPEIVPILARYGLVQVQPAATGTGIPSAPPGN